MREIKFRAWEKNRKEMLEVLGIFFEVGTIRHKPLKLKGNTNPFHEGYPNTYFKDIELMQYTGLKDVSGKEIYEGDVVKNDYGDLHEIKFGELLLDTMDNVGQHIGFYGKPLGQNPTCECVGIGDWKEIIGNVYEHPELLK